MKQNVVNGLSLLGIALTSTGLIETAHGYSKLYLIFAAFLLYILGFYEIYFSKTKK